MSSLVQIGFKADSSQLVTADKRLNKLTKTGASADSSVRALDKSMEALDRSARSQNGVQELAKDASSLREESKSATSSANKLIETTKELDAQTKKTEKSSEDLVRSTNRRAIAQDKTANSSQTLSRKTNMIAISSDSASESTNALSRSIKLLGVALASIGAVRAASEVLSLSESWKNVNNSLRIVIDSEKELIATRNKLLQLSKETRSSMVATTDLYAELRRTTLDLGTSEKELMTTTRTLNNMFAAGGKDVDTQKRAIRQLSQALGAGALRGDEYVSVIEGAPRVLDALAISLNMARGEMRDFAATGGITSQVLIKAMNEYAATAERDLAKTQKTFGQSMTAAKNDAMEFVGELETINSVISSTGESIEYVAGNLDSVSAGLKGVSVVLAASLIPKTIAYTTSLAMQVKAQLMANTAAITTTNVYGQVAVKAASATVATNALGMATRFLLGPWGLLITALGVGATAFITSRDAADEFTKSANTQKKVVADLVKGYEKLNAKQVASNYAEAQQQLIKLDEKRLQIQLKMSAASRGGQFGQSDLMFLKKELENVDGAAKKVQTRIDAVLKLMSNRFDDMNWIDPAEEAKKESAAAAKGARLAAAEYKRWLETVSKYQTPLQAATAEINKINKALAAGDLTASAGVLGLLDKLKQEVADINAQAQQSAYTDWIDGILDQTGELQKVEEEIKAVWQAMDAGDLDTARGLEYLDKLQEKVDDLKGTLSGADMFNTIADSAKDGLAAVQGLSAQGSKEYQKLGIAIQAVSAAQAIFAVLNQGSGDPYSAFGRMAAMAGAVASLGVSVGNFSAGSGFDENIAAEMQANQGLDSWGDKSESITNATEMTADATDKLVGINTNMLKALQTMQQDISSAAALSLRGGLVDYPDVSGKIIGNAYDMGSITGNAFVKEIDNSLKLLDFTTSLGVTGAITKFMGKTLGGSSKNVDQGLFFQGGQLGDLREMTNVFSYATTQYRKWKWGSKKTAETYEYMSDAGTQFALVFDSLANTVFEGASTLGMSADSIERAINKFEIESQKISLKGLDAEAQQKEIEDVFSSIFDDLAGSVVPYAKEFQQVGEGLGETLIRLATEVSILDMMSEQLGVTFGDKLAYPPMYMKIADNLTTLMGGIEAFAEGLSGFIDNFAPDAVKFNIVSDAFSKAMNEVGLGVPETAEGFWQLMQSIDGTTEAGQEQIAAILSSQELARDYFDMLEESSSKLKATAESMRNIITGVYGVSEKIKAQNVDDALTQARRGNFELADKLSNVIPLSSSFTSSAAFKSEQAITANKLAEIADLADGQSTVEMMTLDINKEQRDLLASINDNMRANYNNSANNDTMNEELNMMRAELEELKFANQGIAQSTADSAESLDRLVRDGIEVRTA